MKKSLFYLAFLFWGLFTMSLTSCTPTEEEELQDEVTVAELRQSVVGYWYDGTTDEYWHFFSGTASAESPAQGKNWCESDDIFENEVEPFKWYIESTGLMVLHSVNGNYADPDPECPIKIRDISDVSMTWGTSDGEIRTLKRINK